MTENDNILERPELKNAPFSVPEGYFESLPLRVAGRIAASNAKPAARRLPVRRWWIAAAAAACLAIVAVGGLALSGGRHTDGENLAQGESPETAAIADWLYASGAHVSDFEQLGETEDLNQDEIIEYLAYNGLSGEYIYTALAEAE